MSKTIFSLAVGGLLLALGFPTEAQQAKKVSRIGYLSSTSPSAGACASVCARLETRGSWIVTGIVLFTFAIPLPRFES